MMIKITILIVGFLLGVWYGYNWRKITHDPTIPIVSIVNFTSLNDTDLDEIKKLFDAAVEYHGRYEQYYYHRGKLWLERDGSKIDAVATMKNQTKGKGDRHGR